MLLRKWSVLTRDCPQGDLKENADRHCFLHLLSEPATCEAWLQGDSAR